MQEVFENIITNLENEVLKSSGNMTRTYAFEKAIEIVKQAAADYNNGWIPVSERLPEEYGDYLVAWRPLSMSDEDIMGKVGREVPHFYEIVEYDPDDEALWIGSIEQAQGEYEVIAWQPLPEPYQPKGE